MQILDDPVVRSTLFEYIQRVEAYPDFAEPTAEMWADHDEMMDGMMGISHQTDRGKKELALKLDMSQNRFEALFAGKAVLDVGCGEGMLDGQLARNRGTSITALDHDPAMLAKVPDMPNIRKVAGSGYDIQSALGDEEFDVVLASSSTLLWARRPEQVEKAVDSALTACKVGGIALFIPVLQHLRSQMLYRAELDAGRVPGYSQYEVPTEGLEYAKRVAMAENWLRSVKLRKFEATEDSGRIACAYIASAKNKTNRRINNVLGPEHVHEDFSVVATVLEK